LGVEKGSRGDKSAVSTPLAASAIRLWPPWILVSAGGVPVAGVLAGFRKAATVLSIPNKGNAPLGALLAQPSRSRGYGRVRTIAPFGSTRPFEAYGEGTAGTVGYGRALPAVFPAHVGQAGAPALVYISAAPTGTSSERDPSSSSNMLTPPPGRATPWRARAVAALARPRACRP
jgi:hypothetical protein